MNTQISNISEINVAILAGGFGTRLQSLIRDKPKVLAEIRGHPFLEYLLFQLNQANLKEVILCTGYLSGQIEKAFGRKYKNLRLLYSPEQTPLGTAGSLRNALPLLNSETILVMNGDSYCEVDFKKFWQFHSNKKSKASVVLSEVSDVRHFGTIELGYDDTITAFYEKIKGNGTELVSAGIYLINSDFCSEIPTGKKISLEKDLFPHWVGKEFYGYKCNNQFIDIGTPDSYAKAEKFFACYQL